MGGRPNLQDQACQEGRDRPQCPRFTPRETATDEPLWLIECGRTGLLPQVCHQFTLQSFAHSPKLLVNTSVPAKVPLQLPSRVTPWWCASPVARCQPPPPPLLSLGSRARAWSRDRDGPGRRRPNLCSCLSTKPCLTASDPRLCQHTHTHTHTIPLSFLHPSGTCHLLSWNAAALCVCTPGQL